MALPGNARPEQVSGVVTPARPRRYRDSRQAHYTDCDYIAGYMARLLRPTEHDVIWEPSAGDGHLVSAVLQECCAARVVATDIDEAACAELSARFGSLLEVTCADSLLDSPPIGCTKVIANPPYGAWQSFERRRALAAKFPGLYVKDSYGVFLFQCFEALADSGRMVAIVPATFLYLHRHEFLRRHLLSQGIFEEITQFPSRFFPGVSFGYADLCIVSVTKQPSRAVTKQPSGTQAVVRCFEARDTPHELSQIGAGTIAPGTLVEQARVLQDPNASFAGLITLRSKPSGAPKRAAKRAPAPCTTPLGAIADVKTGFYSGNDRRWVRRLDATIRRSKHYSDVDPNTIVAPSDAVPAIDGIAGKRCFIPLLRGGAAALAKPTTHFVDWSVAAVAEYRRKGKHNPARFQNARFYFREGIAVPMVSSKRLTAALLERRLFDQGIVAVFPLSEDMRWFLLGFLNSTPASLLMQAINPTANNSANYLKRLPVVVPNAAQHQAVSNLTKSLYRRAKAQPLSPDELRLLDRMFADMYPQL